MLTSQEILFSETARNSLTSESQQGSSILIMTHLFTIKELRLCVIQDRRCTVIYMWQSKPALNAITVTYTLMIVVDLMGSIDFFKTYRMDKHI